MSANIRAITHQIASAPQYKRGNSATFKEESGICNLAADSTGTLYNFATISAANTMEGKRLILCLGVTKGISCMATNLLLHTNTVV